MLRVNLDLGNQAFFRPRLPNPKGKTWGAVRVYICKLNTTKLCLTNSFDVVCPIVEPVVSGEGGEEGGGLSI